MREQEPASQPPTHTAFSTAQRSLRPISLGVVGVFLMASYASAAVKETVHTSTKTANWVKPLGITIAKNVATGITPTTMDTNISNVGLILRQKNSDRDVSCPVKTTRSGEIGSILNDFFDFTTVDNEDEYIALRAAFPNHRAKVVRRIPFCDVPPDPDAPPGTPPSPAVGCADHPGTHLVLADDFFWNHTTLAHEYGHNKGLDHAAGEESQIQRRIMYRFGDVDITTPRNEVIGIECTKIKQ